MTRMTCYDHDCTEHGYEDPACDHMVCTQAPLENFPGGVEIMSRAPLVRNPKRIDPPRPDYHWVKGIGRVLHDPELPKYPLPAPPDVAVMVPSDIADDVRIYAERRNAEKRLGRTP